MANFSSFFPVAGGGGGFTKMNKYSTYRALDDATHKLGPAITGVSIGSSPIGDTTIVFDGWTPQNDTFTNVANSMVGYTFTHNSTVHTVTANPAFIKYGADPTFTITPGLTAAMNNDTSVNFAPPLHTVNPATDLGLEDGASIGYFMVGGGFSAYSVNSNDNTGMPGGNILQGTAIISNASTDLILTPGVGGNRNSPTESTITGGLTLTTADGSNIAGFGARLGRNGSYYRGESSAGTGVMGYGVGGATSSGGGASASADSHGWGSGGLRGGSNSQNNQAGDGAILLFY